MSIKITKAHAQQLADTHCPSTGWMVKPGAILINWSYGNISYTDLTEQELVAKLEAIELIAAADKKARQIKWEQERKEKEIATQKTIEEKARKYEVDKLKPAYEPKLNGYGNVGETIPDEFYPITRVFSKNEIDYNDEYLMRNAGLTYKGPYNGGDVAHASIIELLPTKLVELRAQEAEQKRKETEIKEYNEKNKFKVEYGKFVHPNLGIVGWERTLYKSGVQIKTSNWNDGERHAQRHQNNSDFVIYKVEYFDTLQEAEAELTR